MQICVMDINPSEMRRNLTDALPPYF